MVPECIGFSIFLCCVRETFIHWTQCFRTSVSLSFVSTVVPSNSLRDSGESSMLLRYDRLCCDIFISFGQAIACGHSVDTLKTPRAYDTLRGSFRNTLQQCSPALRQTHRSDVCDTFWWAHCPAHWAPPWHQIPDALLCPQPGGSGGQEFRDPKKVVEWKQDSV